MHGSLPHLFSLLLDFQRTSLHWLNSPSIVWMFITYTACGGSLRIYKTQCLTPRSLWPGHTRLSLYLDLLGSKPLLFIHAFSWAPRWSFSSSTSWPLCMSSSGLQNLHSQIHFFSSSHYSVLRLETWETFSFLPCPVPSCFSPMQSTTGFQYSEIVFKCILFSPSSLSLP